MLERIQCSGLLSPRETEALGRKTTVLYTIVIDSSCQSRRVLPPILLGTEVVSTGRDGRDRHGTKEGTIKNYRIDPNSSPCLRDILSPPLSTKVPNEGQNTKY